MEGEDHSVSRNSLATGSKAETYFAEEPDLIAPLFRLALRVVGIVVIHEMKVFEIFRKRKVGSECGHF